MLKATSVVVTLAGTLPRRWKASRPLVSDHDSQNPTNSSAGDPFVAVLNGPATPEGTTAPGLRELQAVTTAASAKLSASRALVTAAATRVGARLSPRDQASPAPPPPRIEPRAEQLFPCNPRRDRSRSQCRATGFARRGAVAPALPA